MLGGQSWLDSGCENRFFFSRINLLCLSIFWNIYTWFCMHLQNPIMEISDDLFHSCAVFRCCCCFAWFAWKQICFGIMAWFMLGSFLISSWTFRFASCSLSILCLYEYYSSLVSFSDPLCYWIIWIVWYLSLCWFLPLNMSVTNYTTLYVFFWGCCKGSHIFIVIYTRCCWSSLIFFWLWIEDMLKFTL